MGTAYNYVLLYGMGSCDIDALRGITWYNMLEIKYGVVWCKAFFFFCASKKMLLKQYPTVGYCFIERSEKLVRKKIASFADVPYLSSEKHCQSYDVLYSNSWKFSVEINLSIL